MKTMIHSIAAVILLSNLANPAFADVLCKKRSGAVVIRTACKLTESLVDPASLGLVGPTGPAGAPGAPGAPGSGGGITACPTGMSLVPTDTATGSASFCVDTAATSSGRAFAFVKYEAAQSGKSMCREQDVSRICKLLGNANDFWMGTVSGNYLGPTAFTARCSGGFNGGIQTFSYAEGYPGPLAEQRNCFY
jgi:hypothetical protein